MSERHPAIADLLEFFDYEHLPKDLQVVSKPIGDLAYQMADSLPDSAEKTVGIRKLLEAKDCLVRVRVQQLKHERDNV
jgi:hypothetical protein